MNEMPQAADVTLEAVEKDMPKRTCMATEGQTYEKVHPELAISAVRLHANEVINNLEKNTQCLGSTADAILALSNALLPIASANNFLCSLGGVQEVDEDMRQVQKAPLVSW